MEKQGSGCFLLKGQQEEVICFFPSFFFFFKQIVAEYWKTDKIKGQNVLLYLPILCIIKFLEEIEKKENSCFQINS